MDAVRGKFKPLSESEPQPIDISLKHVLIFALILFFIIYILSKSNNGGGFGNDDGDVILTRRGRRVYPGGFVPGSFGGGFGGRKWKLEDERCDCEERIIIKQFSNNIKSYQTIQK